LGGAAITLLLNFILIPTIGFMGSAWATLSCYFLMMVTSYFLGQKYFPIQYPIKKISYQVLIAIGFYGLSTLFVKSIYFQFGLFEAHSWQGITTLICISSIALFSFWKMNKKELVL
jgi:O-antigen/teichoic acid export membrane protein